MRFSSTKAYDHTLGQISFSFCSKYLSDSATAAISNTAKERKQYDMMLIQLNELDYLTFQKAIIFFNFKLTPNYVLTRNDYKHSRYHGKNEYWSPNYY